MSTHTPRPHLAAETRPALERLLDDQSQCWERGERLPVEGYLRAYPGLSDAPEALLDLIYHEVVLRSRRGEAPAVEEYLRRFPHLADRVREQFDVHEALFATSPGPAPPAKPAGDLARPAGPASLPEVAGYEVLEELGRGGMGVVYKARQTGLKRLVALKMIHSPVAGGPLDRFRAEAEALARLQNPHVVQVYEVGEHDGRPFLALELLTGGSLDRHLQGAPQPARRAAQLVATLARAVHAAHERGVVHRDLKPANVLLTADGTPKLTDFGLAKDLNDDSGRTRSGDILGTPNYMAPEQARGKSCDITPRTDVYALGAVLYELLTGRPPFNGETMWDTLEQVVRQEPVPPRRLQPKVPRDLETVCLKCLEKEPHKRYASAADLADDCDAFLHGRPTRARPARPWGRAWRWARRRPAAVSAAAAALLGLAGLLAAHEVSQTVAVRESQEQARLATAAAEAQRSLEDAQAAVNAADWGPAGYHVEAALERLARVEGFAGDARLAELRARARGLGDQVRQRLTDQDRYRKLGDLRDAAAFEQMTAPGGPGKARQLAEQALRLFGLTPGSGEPPSLDGTHLTEPQKAQVRECCCELLLGLARAEAGPGGPPAWQEPRSLALAGRLGVSRAAYHRCRADCLARLGREREAAEERRLADACPLSTASDFFLSGGDLYRQGRLDEAVGRLDRALCLQPHHFGSHYALAVCYLKSEAAPGAQRRTHLALAREHLSHCIYQQPGRVWPYLLRGHAHGERGEFEAAFGDFSRVEAALRGEPDAALRYGLLVNRGVARVRAGDLPAAVADLDEAVRLRDRDYPAYVNLAEAYQELGRPDLARAQLDRALALRPPEALAALYRTRARLLRQQGDAAAAARDLGRAAGHEATAAASAADRAEQGRLWLQAGRHAEALEALDAALGLRPRQAGVERLRADALSHLGRDAEAARALGRCLEEGQEGRRGLAPLYRARGEARARLGEHARAAEDYTHALELGRRDAATLAARGWSYLATDAPRLALRDFEEALRGDPASADARGGRGYAAVRLGQYREGCRDAEASLRLRTPDARRLYRAARTFAQAARQAGADGSLPAGPARSLAAEYQERSLELLRQALAALPPEQRASFWSKTVRRDAALNPIRPALAFDRLGRSYSPAEHGSEVP